MVKGGMYVNFDYVIQLDQYILIFRYKNPLAVA